MDILYLDDEQIKDAKPVFGWSHTTRFDGEEALQILEACGSGWIREVIEDAVLDAEVVE